ncbi:hypothetical protein SLA2020_405350 [Shorea laevis]
MGDPEIMATKAGQGILDNDSQYSTNADMGSFGKSNQGRKCRKEEVRISQGNDKKLYVGPSTKKMGLQEEMRPGVTQMADSHKPSSTGPKQ